jgi:hypothetical protein
VLGPDDASTLNPTALAAAATSTAQRAQLLAALLLPVANMYSTIRAPRVPAVLATFAAATTCTAPLDAFTSCCSCWLWVLIELLLLLLLLLLAQRFPEQKGPELEPSHAHQVEVYLGPSTTAGMQQQQH